MITIMISLNNRLQTLDKLKQYQYNDRRMKINNATTAAQCPRGEEGEMRINNWDLPNWKWFCQWMREHTYATTLYEFSEEFSNLKNEAMNFDGDGTEYDSWEWSPAKARNGYGHFLKITR